MNHNKHRTITTQVSKAMNTKQTEPKARRVVVNRVANPYEKKPKQNSGAGGSMASTSENQSRAPRVVPQQQGRKRKQNAAQKAEQVRKCSGGGGQKGRA